MSKQNTASDRREPKGSGGLFHALSLSGGKDSTALLLLMIERGLPIDAVIWADTGMEFPEMYAHIVRVDEHLYRERGLRITALHSPKSFEYMMFDEPKQKPSCLENRTRLGIPPYGNGWPGMRVRWCTGQLKTHLITKELNRLKGKHQLQQYIGIAADEAWRCKGLNYPLVEWGMHMNDYNKITALYSRLSVGDEDRDGGESNSIQNQKIFLENYARGQRLTNIRHYIDDDESGRFFDRSAYSRMMEDVENGKIGVCIMKDLTRWGRDYLQVGNAMEIFRRNNVRFIAVNNGIDSEKPDTLEFAPFINIMSEWYAKDISKKVKTGIKTKGMSGKPIATEAPYGYVKDPDNKDFWIIDEEAAEVVRLIFRLFIGGKNRNQIAVYLKNEQIPTPTFYMKDRGRGTCKNKALNEDNRYKWNKATLTHILTRQEYRQGPVPPWARVH